MDGNDPGNMSKGLKKLYVSKGLKKLYENVTTYQAGADDTMAEIQQLKGMLQQNPNNLDIMEWLAFKLYSVSNYEEAEQLFRNLIAKTGREQEAVRCWKQTVALIPKDVKAKKAQARIEKMAASNPNV
jgi:cytochrome c-type biogenesis protein CcmH/NrfG